MKNALLLTILAAALAACGGKLDEAGAAREDGGISAVSPTASSSASAPRSSGCDVCGDVTCPAGAVVDSACKCLDERAHRYVTPTSQPCDFCSGKRCAAGSFLDWRCECYDPTR